MRRTWTRWLLAMLAGETVGFGVAGLAALLAVSLLPPGLDGLQNALIVAGGTLEGLVLGHAQAWALRRSRLAVPRWGWASLTAGAAFLAWVAGTTFGSLAPDALGGSRWLVPVAAALLVGMGLLMGALQWVELRLHVPRAWLWIPGNALAWALGLVAPMAAGGLVTAATPAPVAVLVVLSAGLLMGLVAAAVTGWVLVVLLREAHVLPPSSSPPPAPPAASR